MKQGNKLGKEKVKLKSNSDEMTNLFKIVITIVILFAAFYVITYFVTESKNNTSENSKDKNIAVIQYDEIMLGTLLTQSPNEYYVLIGKSTNENYKLYQKYVEAYKASDKKDKTVFYTSNLENGFNQPYVADNNHFDVESINEFRISESALIHVEDGKVANSYVGFDNILNQLKDITK